MKTASQSEMVTQSCNPRYYPSIWQLNMHVVDLHACTQFDCGVERMVVSIFNIPGHGSRVAHTTLMYIATQRLCVK